MNSQSLTRHGIVILDPQDAENESIPFGMISSSSKYGQAASVSSSSSLSNDKLIHLQPSYDPEALRESLVKLSTNSKTNSALISNVDSRIEEISHQIESRFSSLTSTAGELNETTKLGKDNLHRLSEEVRMLKLKMLDKSSLDQHASDFNVQLSGVKKRISEVEASCHPGTLNKALEELLSNHPSTKAIDEFIDFQKTHNQDISMRVLKIESRLDEFEKTMNDVERRQVEQISELRKEMQEENDAKRREDFEIMKLFVQNENVQLKRDIVDGAIESLRRDVDAKQGELERKMMKEIVTNIEQDKNQARAFNEAKISESKRETLNEANVATSEICRTQIDAYHLNRHAHREHEPKKNIFDEHLELAVLRDEVEMMMKKFGFQQQQQQQEKAKDDKKEDEVEQVKNNGACNDTEVKDNEEAGRNAEDDDASPTIFDQMEERIISRVLQALIESSDQEMNLRMFQEHHQHQGTASTRETDVVRTSTKIMNKIEHNNNNNNNNNHNNNMNSKHSSVPITTTTAKINSSSLSSQPQRQQQNIPSSSPSSSSLRENPPSIGIHSENSSPSFRPNNNNHNNNASKTVNSNNANPTSTSSTATTSATMMMTSGIRNFNTMTQRRRPLSAASASASVNSLSDVLFRFNEDRFHEEVKPATAQKSYKNSPNRENSVN